MSVILSDETPRARKPHICDQCNCEIAVGQQYRRVRGIWEDTPSSYKAHLDCDQLATTLHNEYGLYPEEGVWLRDEEWSELVLWRGDYPHVICRMELRRQLAGKDGA